jgi:hypothetical protein
VTNVCASAENIFKKTRAVPMSLCYYPFRWEMEQKFEVLNAGSVKLLDHFGSDVDIVNSARVSFASYQNRNG